MTRYYGMAQRQTVFVGTDYGGGICCVTCKNQSMKAPGVVHTPRRTGKYRDVKIRKLIGQTDMMLTMQKPPAERCGRPYQTIQNKEVFAVLNSARVCLVLQGMFKPWEVTTHCGSCVLVQWYIPVPNVGISNSSQESPSSSSWLVPARGPHLAVEELDEAGQCWSSTSMV